MTLQRCCCSVDKRLLTALLKEFQMDLGHSMHVAACACESIGSGGGDVLAGKTLVSKRFEVEAEIKPGVELGLGLSTRGRENVLRPARAAEHLVNLEHGYARVRANGEQCAPGFLE